MATARRKLAWHERIGIGGIASLIGFGGIGFWFWAMRHYVFVLRDEKRFLETPWIFIFVGLFLALAVLIWLKQVAIWQGRVIPRNSQGGKFRKTLTWADIWWAVIPGTTLATIGAGHWLNGVFATAAPRRYQVRVDKKYQRHGARRSGPSFGIWVADWKGSGRLLRLSIKRELYLQIEKGDAVILTTQTGILGYEWLVSGPRKVPFAAPERKD